MVLGEDLGHLTLKLGQTSRFHHPQVSVTLSNVTECLAVKSLQSSVLKNIIPVVKNAFTRTGCGFWNVT